MECVVMAVVETPSIVKFSGPDIAAGIRSAISWIMALQEIAWFNPDDKKLQRAVKGMLRIDRPPVGLAFNIYARFEGREVLLASAAVAKNGGLFLDIDAREGVEGIPNILE